MSPTSAPITVIDGVPIFLTQALGGALAALALLLLVTLIALMRGGAARRREHKSRHRLLALSIALVLLFPVISLTDDLHAEQAAMEAAAECKAA